MLPNRPRYHLNIIMKGFIFVFYVGSVNVANPLKYPAVIQNNTKREICVKAQ